jgi:DNA (cytosine-5)-methyltransferase 1
MKYLSVCSGIEAATVAWHGLDWTPVGFSEIEPFPSAVLQYRYPSVPNLGDMTNYKEWQIERPDLLVGGTPCQSFSVAGLRKGLDDPRGNLALIYCGILDYFRPQWFVWENVPGVLSSGGGRDFGSFLGAVAQLGYGFAYRVLDAQWFGVAQRRRRVFVVGYFGDWRPAAAVLFEYQSLRRDTAPSRQKGQDTATSSAPSVDANGLQRTVGTLCADTHPGAYSGQDAYTGRLVPSVVGTLDSRHAGGFQSVQSAGAGHLRAVETPEVMCTLRATGAGFDRPGNAATEHETYIPMAQPVAFAQNTRDEVRYVNGDGQISGALAAQPGMKQTTYVAQTISIHPHCIGRSPEAGPQGKEYLMDGSAYCMDSRGQPQAVAHPIGLDEEQNAMVNRFGTLKARMAGGGFEGSVMQTNMQVRRLTPVECERLQGFPDNYTEIPWRGKTETPDGPRYKALGNSMAVPVMQWIGEGIDDVNSLG